MRSLAALAARLSGPAPIIGEISGPVAGPRPFCLVPMTAAVACLATFAAGLRRAFTIVREVPGTILAADMAGSRRLFAVFSEVSRIACMPFLCHGCPLSGCIIVPGC